MKIYTQSSMDQLQTDLRAVAVRDTVSSDLASKALEIVKQLRRRVAGLLQDRVHRDRIIERWYHESKQHEETIRRLQKTVEGVGQMRHGVEIDKDEVSVASDRDLEYWRRAAIREVVTSGRVIQCLHESLAEMQSKLARVEAINRSYVNEQIEKAPEVARLKAALLMAQQGFEKLLEVGRLPDFVVQGWAQGASDAINYPSKVTVEDAS